MRNSRLVKTKSLKAKLLIQTQIKVGNVFLKNQKHILKVDWQEVKPTETLFKDLNKSYKL